MASKYIQDEVYNPYKIKGLSLSKQVLYTFIFKEYISTKMTLDNYDGHMD
jgi:hypothetical protein